MISFKLVSIIYRSGSISGKSQQIVPGYKQRVYKDNTTYLLGSGITLASGATGGAGAAEAAAHTETSATEEILVTVRGEYEQMVEN